MEANPYQDSNGNLIGVTGIAVSQLDWPINGIDQPYDPSIPSPQGVSLYSGQPGETYGINVSWQDGSSYNTVIQDHYGGAFVEVPGPNQGAGVTQQQTLQQSIDQAQSTLATLKQQDPALAAQAEKALAQAEAALAAMKAEPPANPPAAQ